MAKDKEQERLYKEERLRRTKIRKAIRCERKADRRMRYGRKSESKCPYCEGQMTWCSICERWSSYCCEKYGTCMCS